MPLWSLSERVGLGCWCAPFLSVLLPPVVPGAWPVPKMTFPVRSLLTISSAIGEPCCTNSWAKMVSPPISAYLCVTGSLRDSGICSVVWNVASHTTGAPEGSWLLLHPVLMCLSAFRNCYFAQLWECECKVFVPRSPLVRAEWLLLH